MTNSCRDPQSCVDFSGLRGPDSAINVLWREKMKFIAESDFLWFDMHFLKGAAVHSILVFQVKGKPGRAAGRGYFSFERERLSRIRVNDRHSSQTCAMFVVEVRDEAS